MKQANKRAISIHTVAGKIQNTLASVGTAAPVYLKKITVIDLSICKISMCFLLAFQIWSKLCKNCWISLCIVRDPIGSDYGSKKPVLKTTGEEEDF